MMKVALLLTPLATLSLSACVAADIVTAPIKIGSRAVDLATTSLSEADENRGREIRKREEKLGKLERQYRKEREKCEKGKQSACEDARETYAEIQELLPTIPAEPDD
ncbi:MAG: hypothetical protein AAF697_14030 [Pseudomonadota bacterium]